MRPYNPYVSSPLSHRMVASPPGQCSGCCCTLPSSVQLSSASASMSGEHGWSIQRQTDIHTGMAGRPLSLSLSAACADSPFNKLSGHDHWKSLSPLLVLTAGAVPLSGPKTDMPTLRAPRLHRCNAFGCKPAVEPKRARQDKTRRDNNSNNEKTTPAFSVPACLPACL